MFDGLSPLLRGDADEIAGWLRFADVGKILPVRLRHFGRLGRIRMYRGNLARPAPIALHRD
jgi:hypothetical protein